MDFLSDWSIFLLIPGMLLAAWAQTKVTTTFNKYSKVYSSRNSQAQDIAEKILRSSEILDVEVNPIAGNLTDNYNPTNKTLNLSQSVYGSSSIAAIGVAAHEAGHAIQHGTQYRPLAMRSIIYPVVKIGSTLSWPIFLAGLIFSFQPLLKIGILAFSFAVIFSLITLPVEFNASKRAISILSAQGYLIDD